MYVKSKFLKENMTLEKDVLYYYNNFETVMLTEGHVLSNNEIDRIKLMNIEGVHVRVDGVKQLRMEPEISTNLQNKSLIKIREVSDELKTKGKISKTSINKYSDIANDLINEIYEKMILSKNLLNFKNYDEYTFQHCLNVASLNIQTGISLNLSESMLHDLGMVGLLHDIGKTHIPIEILNKPGKLSPEEFDIIKSHPSKAVKILDNMVSDDILRAIEEHHEKLDSTGYPYGKSKDEISLYAKITSICDVFHALSSSRSYRKACFPGEVVEYLMGCTDSHFDYDILKVFIKNIIAYPIGSFVKLSNNLTGFVIKNHRENPMRPIVRILNPDNTSGWDIDLFKDHNYMNVTILETEYDCGDIDYNSISRFDRCENK